jgi:hypothetical protein
VGHWPLVDEEQVPLLHRQPPLLQQVVVFPLLAQQVLEGQHSALLPLPQVMLEAGSALVQPLASTGRTANPASTAAPRTLPR